MNSKNRIVPFMLTFVILFGLFTAIGFLFSNVDWTWIRILNCVVVISGVTVSWSLVKQVALVQAFREVGFGTPEWRAVAIALVVSALMLSFFPLYSSLARTKLELQSNWIWILVGIITGVGIAEETLFRGYVFNFFRERFPFWKAATYSMFLFAAMHLLLLFWLPLPIAIAAIFLAILAAYPTAYLFEKGNRTIWAPAILHSSALATNLFVVPLEMSVSLSLLWICVVVIGSFLVFPAGRALFRARFNEQFVTSV